MVEWRHRDGKGNFYESSQSLSTAFEDNTHVFIVRIWLEPRDIEGAPSECRGEIEHVPSGQRRYLKGLDGMEVFVSSWLKAHGVDCEAGARELGDGS